jgi:hypothetical protein
VRSQVTKLTLLYTADPLNEPDVTPSGTVVSGIMTAAATPGGAGACMCEAVVPTGPVSPAKVTEYVKVLVPVSYVNVPDPLPLLALGGVSCEPVSVALQVIRPELAWAI